MKALQLFKFLVVSFSLVLFWQLSNYGQSLTTNTFDKDNLKFNYPSDWTLTDKSTPEIQQLFLSKNDSSVLIMIISPLETIKSKSPYTATQRNIFKNYSTAIAKSLNVFENSDNQEFLCLDFNGTNISGSKITGIYKGEPSIGEIYPFILANRFLTIIYMRMDKDGKIGDNVWDNLLKSLTINGSNKDVFGYFETEGLSRGIVNGRAIKLVQPRYSSYQYKAGARGKVEVEVILDETGKVISAKAISGHTLLYGDAEYAARKSTFSPTTVCGKPIKVSGKIVYNFGN